ncbi:MAG: hypothetical protein K2H52_13975 [Lachnospiraceae bacterium]|nr:hypothetical protein [Lachnospiraceae bacterium]
MNDSFQPHAAVSSIETGCGCTEGRHVSTGGKVIMDDCIYNTGGICYADLEPKECQYIGNEEDCGQAEES